MIQKRLSTKEHWKINYENITLKKKFILPEALYYTQLTNLLKNRITNNHKTILEIGCAPGNHAIKLAKSLNLIDNEPHGFNFE